MSRDVSSGEFDRAQVARAAQLTIDAIMANRVREREREVAYAARRRTFLGFDITRTRQQAEAYIAMIEESSGRMNAPTWKIRGWGSLETAQRLLKLATFAVGSTVRVSKDDFEDICLHWEEAAEKEPHSIFYKFNPALIWIE